MLKLNIELETLMLKRYNDIEHNFVKEDLERGMSSSKYIHQIGERLEQSKENKTIYQSGYVVEDRGTPIGYAFISSMHADEVFLEYSILRQFRNMGYGSALVRELTTYLFENHNIRSIRLDIDPSNQNSILVANACGYSVDEEEFEARNFTGKMQFIKENEFYISKRRK